MDFFSDKMFLLITLLLKIQHTFSTSAFFKQIQYGYIPLSKTSDIFYWLIPSKHDKNNDPLIIWLSGGPACSSTLAMFFENGPKKIKSDLSLEDNEYSWNQKANVLYIDQPIGTGFSSTSADDELPSTQKEVVKTFAKFLKKWFDEFPLFKNRKLFFAGESYAGKHIPTICNYLLKNKFEGLNLQGAAIGNGWVDPYNTFKTLLNYAQDNNLIKEDQRKTYQPYLAKCFNGMEKKNYEKETVQNCYVALYNIPDQLNLNKYNIDKQCEGQPYCYNFSNIEKYFNQTHVIRQLSAQGRNWSICNNTIRFRFLNEWIKDVRKEMISLLNQDFKILIYQGERDFIQNSYGTIRWADKLNWNQKTQFNQNQYKELTQNGQSIGKIKSSGPLTVFIIYGAGHMVPHDKPELSLQMINKFINNEPLIFE